MFCCGCHRKWETLECSAVDAIGNGRLLNRIKNVQRFAPQSPPFGRHVRRGEETLLLTSSDGESLRHHCHLVKAGAAHGDVLGSHN